MSVRLQVILDDDEATAVRRAARNQHLTVSAWVRQSLRAACDQLPTADAGRRIDAIRAAARYEFPTADIDAMLAEIEGACQAEAPP